MGCHSSTESNPLLHSNTDHQKHHKSPIVELGDLVRDAQGSQKPAGWRYANTEHRVFICRFCGGAGCKREDYTRQNGEHAINGLHSSWVTPTMLAMQRPSNRLLQEFKIIQEFKKHNIICVVNLQMAGEHPLCGDGIGENGFSYNPDIFMDAGIHYYNFPFVDMHTPSMFLMVQIVQTIHKHLTEASGCSWINPPKVAIHCHAGQGRTGIAIACYLLYAYAVGNRDALTCDEVIKVVRAGRKGSVETSKQVQFVRSFADYLENIYRVFPATPPVTCARESRLPSLQELLSNQGVYTEPGEFYESAWMLRSVPKFVAVTTACISTWMTADGLDARDKQHLHESALTAFSFDEYCKRALFSVGVQQDVSLSVEPWSYVQELDLFHMKRRINVGDWTWVNCVELPGQNSVVREAGTRLHSAHNSHYSASHLFQALYDLLEGLAEAPLADVQLMRDTACVLCNQGMDKETKEDETRTVPLLPGRKAGALSVSVRTSIDDLSCIEGCEHCGITDETPRARLSCFHVMRVFMSYRLQNDNALLSWDEWEDVLRLDDADMLFCVMSRCISPKIAILLALLAALAPALPDDESKHPPDSPSLQPERKTVSQATVIFRAFYCRLTYALLLPPVDLCGSDGHTHMFRTFRFALPERTDVVDSKISSPRSSLKTDVSDVPLSPRFTASPQKTSPFTPRAREFIRSRGFFDSDATSSDRAAAVVPPTAPSVESAEADEEKLSAAPVVRYLLSKFGATAEDDFDKIELDPKFLRDPYHPAQALPRVLTPPATATANEQNAAKVLWPFEMLVGFAVIMSRFLPLYAGGVKPDAIMAFSPRSMSRRALYSPRSE